MKGEFIVVLVTVGSEDEGDKIARTLVHERLAACVNVVGPVRSVYSWKGAVEADEERILVIKSRAALLEPLEHRVQALHSYEVPEIIALPVSGGSQSYLDWLRESTGG